MNLIYRLFLTFNATSLIVVLYAIKQEVLFSRWLVFIEDLPNYISYLFYCMISLFLTFISLYLSKFLAQDDFKKGSLIEIEQANNTFLPSYLGYFFVALSVPRFESLVFVFIILFAFTFFSQTLYFNPLFLIFGYYFYYIKTKNNVKLFVITKQSLKDPLDVEFTSLRRINNYTFIDK